MRWRAQSNPPVQPRLIDDPAVAVNQTLVRRHRLGMCR